MFFSDFLSLIFYSLFIDLHKRRKNNSREINKVLLIKSNKSFFGEKLISLFYGSYKSP